MTPGGTEPEGCAAAETEAAFTDELPQPFEYDEAFNNVILCSFPLMSE